MTPVNVSNLENLLYKSGYDKVKSKFLINGFKKGFQIGFKGNRKVKRNAPNLKFTIGNEVKLWNKVMKEVEAKRYAGPFEKYSL